MKINKNMIYATIVAEAVDEAVWINLIMGDFRHWETYFGKGYTSYQMLGELELCAKKQYPEVFK